MKTNEEQFTMHLQHSTTWFFLLVAGAVTAALESQPIFPILYVVIKIVHCNSDLLA